MHYSPGIDECKFTNLVCSRISVLIKVSKLSDSKTLFIKSTIPQSFLI